MNFEDLTPEQMEKVKACKTSEELLNLAKKEGHPLSLEELESISGGDHWACNCDSGYQQYSPVN